MLASDQFSKILKNMPNSEPASSLIESWACLTKRKYFAKIRVRNFSQRR